MPEEAAWKTEREAPGVGGARPFKSWAPVVEGASSPSFFLWLFCLFLPPAAVAILRSSVSIATCYLLRGGAHWAVLPLLSTRRWTIFAHFSCNRSSFFCSVFTFIDSMVTPNQSENVLAQECLSIVSLFLDDQREMSCPSLDQHLLPFGHSAPSLLTWNFRNKNKSVGVGRLKVLWDFGILCFWFLANMRQRCFGDFFIVVCFGYWMLDPGPWPC